MKKSLSSIAVRKVVEEAKVLEGAFFQKAYQLDYGTLVLRFAIRKELLKERGDHPFIQRILGNETKDEEVEVEGISLNEGIGSYAKFDLYFRMGGFLFFSPQISSDMPKEPSHFAMKLRKSLKNRILNNIAQVKMDRIVVLTFNPLPGEEEERKLYLELFGDGNAIIVKGEEIETAFTSRSWSSRIVKRGEVFSPPPSGPDPFKITKEDFDIFLASSTDDLVRFLIRRTNLPPAIAEEVCFRVGIEKKTSIPALIPDQREDLWSVFNKIMEDIESGMDVYVYFHRGEPSILEPFFLTSFFDTRDVNVAMSRFEASVTREVDDHFRGIGSINQAIETFMFEETSPVPEKDRKKERVVDKLGKLLRSQEKAREDREEEAVSSKVHADALYVHYQAIDDLLKGFTIEAFREDRSLFPDVKSFTSNDRGDISLRVKVVTDRGEEEVDLVLSMDINQNADRLYEASKKARKKIEGIDKAIRMTKDKIEKAQKEDDDRVEQLEKIKKKLRKFWFETFRWCFSSDGTLMIAGRDARSNERVVKKYMRDNDIYAHADISGAASVVIRAEDEQEIVEESKVQGCHLSVRYSKAWNAKVGSAGAYWVLPDQVSRTAQSGEFVAKGSFIVRGKKNMVDKLPLVGAAGTIYVEGVPKIMFGPESAVAAICKGSYFRIRPGKTKKSDAVRSLAAELGGEMEQVMSVLPADNMELEKVERSIE